MRPDADAVSRSGPAPGTVRPAGFGGSEHLRSALEGSPLPMVLVDPHQADEPIVLANAAFSRMTGYGPSEIVGRNCRFLQGPQSDPEVVDRIRQAVRSRTELSVEILNYRKNGTPFRNALYLSPVFGGDGDLAYLLASQVDVSALHPAGDGPVPPGALESRVGGLAHDLRNMFQVITGSMEVIGHHAEASGDARLIRRIRAVAEAAARATALTAELVAVARGRVSAGAVDAVASGRPVGLEPGDSAAGSGGDRILVVDDRAEIADLARSMLESLGYRVEVAGSGEAALDRLPAGFDLLFTDLVMPGALDGLGLAREARRRYPGLKVLLTTGDPHRAAVGDGPSGGEFATIVKPYRRADLADEVRSVLRGSVGPGRR